MALKKFLPVKISIFFISDVWANDVEIYRLLVENGATMGVSAYMLCLYPPEFQVADETR
jgi:hypothetical protein